MTRSAALALLLLCAGCAAERPRFLDEPPRRESATPDTGSCRPWFVGSPLWSDEAPPRHSCWNLAWEVPVALVAVPLALGALTAPVWAPIVLLR